MDKTSWAYIKCYQVKVPIETLRAILGSELKTDEEILRAVAETVPDNSITLGKSGYIHTVCINPVGFVYSTWYSRTQGF